MATSAMTRLRRDVALGTLSQGDASRMYRWMLDPHVSRNIGLEREPSLEYTRAWIEQSEKADDVRAFTILRAGKHVGNVVLDRIDSESGSARFSIYVGEPEARGRGVGRTALFRILEIGFHDLSLREIWLTVHPENRAAMKIYEAAGFHERAPAPAGRQAVGSAPATITMSVDPKQFDECLRRAKDERV